MISNILVKFIGHREKHHSDHSGYDQIAHRIGTEVKLIDIEHRGSRIVPARIANVLWRKSGVQSYGYLQFYLEVSAAVDMLKSRHCIYHFLYGEHSYRYLSLMPKIRGHRIVATMHLPSSRLFQVVSDPSYLRSLDAAVVVGRNQIPALERLVGRNKVFWVPLGVDTHYFVPPAHRVPGNPPLCLFVGIHLRDFETLCRTIRIVNEKNASVHFIVVTFESEFSRFRGLPNVNLRCNVPEPELLALYQHADLLLQPMHDCTANTSTLEALSCGLPVVASDVGGARDYLDEKCSVLVPAGDADTMADVVLNLLGDHARRRRLSDGALQKSHGFGWESVIEKLGAVYTKILGQATRPP